MHMHAVFSSGVRLGTGHSTVVHLFFHPLTTYIETHLSLALFFSPLTLLPYPLFLVSHLLDVQHSAALTPGRRRICPVQLDRLSHA